MSETDLLAGPVTLITGTTGFLGRNLLFRRLLADPQERFAVLVRSSRDASAQQRIDRLLERGFGAQGARDLAPRVQVVEGDITEPGLGLGGRDYAALPARVERIVHSAATVDFDLPLERAREVNVGGTTEMLTLAEQAYRAGALRRMDYVGTAFVCGTRTGTVTEQELAAGQGFRNTYEQTKLESEQVVRSRFGDLPLAVHRPSIIVGDSSTGSTSAFNVLYFPLKIYKRGWMRTMPAQRDVRVDTVPVDYVCDAITALSATDASLGHAHHLVAGHDATTLGRICERAQEVFDAKPVRFLSPRVFDSVAWPLIRLATLPKPRLRRTLTTAVALYRPYLSMGMVFDDSRTRAVLAPLGLTPPTVEDYFTRVLQYCADTDFGARPIAGGSGPEEPGHEARRHAFAVRQ